MADLTGTTPANTYKGLLQVNDYTDGIAGNTGSNALAIQDGAGNATALAISTDNVGIGTTGPTQKLTVINSLSLGAPEEFACGIFAGGSFTNSKGLKIYAGSNSPTTAGDCIYVGFTDGDNTAAGGIRNSSSVSTPEFFSGSDVRMKKNIQDTDIQGVESIKQLKLRKWEWNTDKQTPVTDIGLVADELEAVFPELVSRTELSGWGHCIGEGEEQLKTIPSESKITLTLIKAVQEQQQLIEDLKSRIETLENK